MINETIYISGPMTGLTDLNFPAFHAAAAQLRAKGFTVVNPAEFGEGEGKEWVDYMRKDIKALMDCSMVATLPNWIESKGARLEVGIAVTLGMRVDSLKRWLE